MIDMIQQEGSAAVSLPAGPVALVFSGLSQSMLSYRREGASLVISFAGFGRDELVLSEWLDAVTGMPAYDLLLDFGGGEQVKLDAATLFSILTLGSANDDHMHDGATPR